MVCVRAPFCAAQAMDRSQRNDDHSHMNCNEFQKINYTKMVDTELSVCTRRQPASVASEPHTFRMFIYASTPQVVSVVCRHFSCALSLSESNQGREEKKNAFFSVQHACARALARAEPTYSHTR